ncbi:VOC family protein [Acidobacteria bacterium AB60]|nr:VOC family protein [Acidobacteria bacterium AB60]
MNPGSQPQPTIPTTIAPWLSVAGGADAVAFYTASFGAEQVYRIEDPDGNVVARLSIDGAEFWLSDDSSRTSDSAPAVRMILTVPDPDAVFGRAIAAGAQVVCPVSEEHGWRVGRLVDPFGHHWEVARPVGDAGSSG